MDADAAAAAAAAAAATAAANARKEWSGSLRSMPIFKADRASGESWRYFRQSWMLWHSCNGIQEIADVGMQKTGLSFAMRDAAQRAIQLHGPGTASFNGAATLEDYMNVLQSVFQPAAESNMARQDFQNRKQYAREPVTEYLADKFALYNAAEPDPGNRNFPHLRQQTLVGLHSNWVKQEVIRANPQDEGTLQNACVAAVGQAREAYQLGCGIVSNLDGLAGTTITSKYSQPDAEDMEIGKVEDDRKCFNCDKRGHLAAKCPKKGGKGTKRESGGKDGIVCHYCDKPGHKRPDCRKLKRDEKEGKVDPKAKGRRSGVKKTGDAEDEDSETYPESDDEDSERSGSGGLSAIYEPVFRM